jgi:hypothetical protein
VAEENEVEVEETVDEFEQGWADAVDEKPQMEEPGDEPVETPSDDAEIPEVEEDTDSVADEGDTPSEGDTDWENIPESYRTEYESAQAKIKELEHSVASGNGRVSALSRKLADVETPQPTPLEEGVTPPSGELWTNLQEEYPDIANGTNERLGEIESRVERMVEERLAPLRQMEEERYVDSQLNMVAQSYPDWQETVHSADFGSWVEQQPLKVQDLRKSYESEDYIYLLKCYNADKSEQVEEIRSSRQDVLKSNVAVPKRGRSKPSGPPDDFDSAFAYYADQD